MYRSILYIDSKHKFVFNNNLLNLFICSYSFYDKILFCNQNLVNALF